MNNQTKGKLGIVCAVCVVLIVVGAIAGWQLYEIYTAESEVHGEPTFTVIDDGIEISDDDSVFLSYKIRALAMDPVGMHYEQTITFGAMEYDYQNCDYELYLNGIALPVTLRIGQIDANMENIVFYTPEGTPNEMPVSIRLDFYNDRTELVISTEEERAVGYLNQMTRSENGISIVVVESPRDKDSQFSGIAELNGVRFDKTEIWF